MASEYAYNYGTPQVKNDFVAWSVPSLCQVAHCLTRVPLPLGTYVLSQRERRFTVVRYNECFLI